MKIRTVLVEDEIPSLSLLRDLLSSFENIHIVGEARDGETAIRMINEKKPALVFLDVQLPIFNGFEVLEYLTTKPSIVFTTAYDEYALKAFEVNAVDYILKPINEERLKISVDRYKSTSNSNEENASQFHSLLTYHREQQRYLERIVVRNKYDYVVINIQDIYYFRIDDGLLFLHTHNNKFLVDFSLSALEKKLNPSIFFRTHRKVIVNLSKIIRIIPWGNSTYMVEFPNKEKVELSRSHLSDFKQIMGYKC
jgi:two-component system LytT family response regulator